MNVNVNLGSRSYRIVVAAGALATVGPRLRELSVGTRTALVHDAAVARLYGKTVASSLESAGFSVVPIEVPEGEGAKTLAVAQHCWNELIAAGLDRTSTVLALGGGAVGDVAGVRAAPGGAGARWAAWRFSPPRRTCAASASSRSRRRSWPRSTPPSAARRRSTTRW